MNKEERDAEQAARKAGREQRLSESQARQKAADIETYGKDSQLLKDQKSSSGGDARGGIFDISTDNYKQPDRNQTGQNTDIDEDGIDTIGAGNQAEPSDGGGLGDATILLDYVDVDNAIQQATFVIVSA